MEDTSKIVLVDLNAIYNNPSTEVIEKINEHYKNEDIVLIALTYNWLQEKINGEGLNILKTWLADVGIKYHQFLINYLVKTIPINEAEWGLKADVYIPES